MSHEEILWHEPFAMHRHPSTIDHNKRGNQPDLRLYDLKFIEIARVSTPNIPSVTTF